MAAAELEKGSSGTGPDEQDVQREPGRYKLAAGSLGQYLKRPLILIGLFAVAFGVMGFQYFQIISHQKALQSSIAEQQAALSAPVPDFSKVTAEKSFLSAQQDALESLRVSELPDSEVMALTLVAASTANVNVHMEGALPSAVIEIDGTEYISTAVQIQADGTLADLQLFLDEFEMRTFETLEIKDVTISASGDSYSMSLRAVVYSQPDDALSFVPALGDTAAGQPSGAPGAQVSAGATR